MKKLFTFLLASVVLAGVAVFAKPASALAVSPTVQVGIVQGLVSGQGGAALSGATMSVLCNGQTLGTTSDGSGFYSVQFGNGICTAGKSVVVTASKNGQSGSNGGVMQPDGTIGFLHLDVAVVLVQVVPEFGLIGGTFAAMASIAGYMFLKAKAVVKV